MILAKQIITVYNKYSGLLNPPMPPTEGWNKTVIRFAQWEDATDRNATQAGVTFIDKHISILIPKTANTMNKNYVKNIDWAKLAVDQKLLTWTLKPEDYIALGETPDITSVFTISNLVANYKCCLIKSIEDLSDQPILPHWEVAGI